VSGPGFEDYPYISADRPKQGATAVWRYHSGLLRFDFNLVVSKSDRGRMLYIANTSAFGAGMEIYRFECAGGETTIDYEAQRAQFVGTSVCRHDESQTGKTD